uniref:phenylalanine--tRNA ligase n=1 Tax=Chondria sp. (in: red algae) TaxID=1982705 RepID=A0A1Z1MRL7_9FLOR|nr:Phenylalanine-tRNA ligase beta subunit [Chondria sp. (in: red algae)]
MKFSWKLINYFIDIEHIKPEVLEEKLALSGIEVERIKKIKDIKDFILDVSLTSNRKDIYSTISLAKELGLIINEKLKLTPINSFGKLNKYKITKSAINKSFVNINEISNIQINKTPQWIIDLLKIYNIKNSNIIYDIQKYIEIKWGNTFYILTKYDILSNLNLIDKGIQITNKIIFNYIMLNYNDNKKFLVFTNYNANNATKSKINNHDSEYYYNSYINTITLLNTFTKCKIGKSYCIFTTTNEHKNIKRIEIKKETIDTILGRIKSSNFKYISGTNIFSTLNRLNLLPKYNQLTKTFLIQVPQTRKDDLSRPIDIIEEIGRIEGFNHFLDQLRKTNTKGNIDKTSLKVKQIRKILRQLGLNEVINCCLINNNFHNNDVKIYNPLTQDQCELRSNILQNLINNYIYNIKQTNDDHRIEIFEIGKIFQEKLQDNYKEEAHLGGLIYNNNFIRENWYTESINGNFFHCKGFIEILLEQLNSKVYFSKIDDYTQIISQQRRFFHHIKHIGIYQQNNKKLIGILGEINPICVKEVNITKSKVYIFEININRLITSIKPNSHLNYIIKPYSSYPSVTRDISIKISKRRSIQSIKEIFSKNYNSLIKSVKIFNEYLNKESNMKSISLRIKYESKERTLNANDIEKIDKEIYYLLSKFESKT